MVRILLIDDHAVVRNGVKTTLEDNFGDIVYGEAANTAEALAKLKDKWDAIILDIGLGNENGLDLLEKIREKCDTPVLVWSAYREEDHGPRAMSKGANGYLNKQCEPDELALAVKTLMEGKSYITPVLANCMAAEMRRPVNPHEDLSAREFELLVLIAKGTQMKDVAEVWGVSYKSVTTTHRRLLEKMKVSTDVELTRYALKHGLVD